MLGIAHKTDVSLSVRPSIHPSVRPSIRPSIRLSGCKSVRMANAPALEFLAEPLYSTGWAGLSGGKESLNGGNEGLSRTKEGLCGRLVWRWGGPDGD